MGIPGLTSFINRNSTEYFENYQLKDNLVIIDGYALTNFLYRQYENNTSAFGGDYDIIAKVYVDFINLLLGCNVTPVIVFDGAYEQRKIETIMQRMSQRINSYSKPIKTNECMPYFGSHIFFDILNDMDIPHVNCDFEADAEIVTLAKLLNCPVISRDSDFYVNTVSYIPLDMIAIDLKSTEKAINCRIYRVEKLLNEFGGLNIDYLPLVAALLGNDYIRSDIFNSLLGIHFKTANCGLKLKRITDWLRKQRNINSAIDNMIKNLNYNNNYIKNQILNIIQDYKNMDSKYLSFILNYDRMSKYRDYLKNYSKVNEKSILPQLLEHNYRKGTINSDVMTILTLKKIIFQVQIEDCKELPYFKVGFKILERILGLLFENKDQMIPGIGRKTELNIGQYKIKPYVFKHYVPLADLHKTDLEYRKKIILELIGNKSINGVPTEWELYILIIIYWAIQTNNCKSKYMHALIISAITFNIIKPIKTDSLSITFEDSTPKIKSIIEENIIKVNKTDCIKAMSVLSTYLQINEYNDTRLYNKIIHPFAQFQSCVNFFMILNSLLNFPYAQCRIEKFYKGSFLYNLCIKMKNCDPEVFISQQLFDDNLHSLKTVYKSFIRYLEKLLPVSKRKVTNNKNKTTENNSSKTASVSRKRTQNKN